MTWHLGQHLNFFRNTVFVLLLALIAGCGGGSGGSGTATDPSGSGSSNGQENGSGSGSEQTNKLTLINSFSLPYGYESGNILLDQNRVILAGGMRGWPTGAQHNGHLAFTDKIYVIDLDTNSQMDFSIYAENGHGFGSQVGQGIGNDAIIRKLTDNRYLIYGGYQYVVSTFILDLSTNAIETYPTSTVEITDTDHGGNNRTPFYANIQASAVLDNGGYKFFGFNNGLYGLGTILSFDTNSLSYQVLDTALAMPRSNIDAYTLPDGKILLVGGWDGTAEITPESATRRVELYDPATTNIERVADYPEPKSGGQHRTATFPKNDDAICVGNYTYTLASKSWTSGCEISSTNNEQEYVQPTPLPENSTTSATLLGQASNGKVVFVERGYQGTTSPFSDDCNCNPYTEGVKVHVYSVEQ
ncbi:hypothetical protein AB835_11845 [Candidatus Endobugula sertula]|uniref:Uncharacterized protein n=1 Tax=Candidatus Endobugula sertula TaxID=62101 RepID=A0A1D2QMV7_9GAMM|nr:hypothetical protein AB835_11845 [Candidatus Endobugula sertula]